MSFMTLKNVRAKALVKTFQKKFFHGFCMFFKFKRSVFDFFKTFFHCFLSAIIKEEMKNTKVHNFEWL